MDASSQPHPDSAGGRPGSSVDGDLASQLSELARSLQGEQDFEATLATMVTAVLDLVPGAAEASISVVEARTAISSHAPSSELPATVDRLQEETGEGPCMDAAWEERIVRVPDFATEVRWSALAPAAAGAGAQSMLCFQLWVEADNLGALNIYGSIPHAFDAESEEVGLLVAAHAAVAFADAQQISGLKEALATRDLIGQAKGILMERYKITDQQAFLLLTRVSSLTNTKLRAVAEHLTSTGSLPGQS
ncbi:GAF and ANTAR domain-containing protein [Kocuria sp. CPCC 205268]